jgi:PAS domain-containing protein
MTCDQEQNLEGRRALFFGAGAASARGATIAEADVEQAALQISAMDEEKPLQYPPSLEPVVTRIHTLLQKIQDQEISVTDLESQLLLKNELISTLQNENIQLSSERESYLDDLITSHTEFDRALEIFQYHEVPMVLTGPDRTVHDANDAFCTLFSIKRSEITTSHPALDRYFPDTPGIEGPDGEQYAVVSLSPPIVPFDHETASLVILIKTASLPIPAEPSVISPPSWESEEEVPCSSDDHDDTALIAFDAFPIPAAVINEYHTITLCNAAFCDLLGRTREVTRFRDIGSCGIRYEDAARITTIVNEQIPGQCDAVITRPDGTDVSVYLTGSPLYSSSSGPLGLIVGLRVSEHEDVGAPVSETSLASVDDLMLQLMLDLNPSAVAFLDKHARVMKSNEGFSELTGLSPADLTGTDVRDLGVCIPDEIWTLPNPEVRYLSGIIRMESLWGVQELSGIIAPSGELSP